MPLQILGQLVAIWVFLCLSVDIGIMVAAVCFREKKRLGDATLFAPIELAPDGVPEPDSEPCSQQHRLAPIQHTTQLMPSAKYTNVKHNITDGLHNVIFSNCKFFISFN